jgi:hypothetical protein
MPEYLEMMDDQSAQMPTQEISYTLAHNIIYAGLQFAEDYGFAPHKDFAVTRCILEEDTDDIELIDINCGEDGVPCYVRGIDDSKHKVKQVLAQLAKTAGPGNYNFIPDDEDGPDEFDTDYEEDNLTTEDEENEFSKLSAEEKKQLFLKLSGSDMDEMGSLDDFQRLLDLTDDIFSDLCDFDVVSDCLDEFYDDFGIELPDVDEITNEFMGVSSSAKGNDAELKDAVIDAVGKLDDGDREAFKTISAYRKKYPAVPVFCYLELESRLDEEDEEYRKKLEEYSGLFPEYGPLKLHRANKSIREWKASGTETPMPWVTFKYVYGERELVHPREMFLYLSHQLLRFTLQPNLVQIEAFNTMLENFDTLPGNFYNTLQILLSMLRIKVLNEYYKN